MSVNKLFLLGRLGKDPEPVKHDTLAACKFSLATSEKVKGVEKSEWHNITCYGKTAENCMKYLKKGRQVFLEGKITYRSWDDNETGTKKYMTVIMANSVQFISDGSNKQATTEQPTAEYTTSDIPF